MRDSNSLGDNDPDGTVRCHLCDWYRKCYSLEQIEFELNRHLREQHNLIAISRTDDDSGKKTPIP